MISCFFLTQVDKLLNAPRTYYRPSLTSGLCPPQPIPLLGHAPSLPAPPHLSDGLRSFKSNIFPYKNLQNLIPVVLPPYTTYEDETDRVFRNIGT